jgi:LacI family transcriptional regulator
LRKAGPVVLAHRDDHHETRPMVTMTEVARAAGVSLATVSHVVNGTRVVSAATRERVLAAAQRLGFDDERLTAARTRRATVGVVVPSASSPYFGELIEGLSAEARRLDSVVMLMTTEEDPDLEQAAVHELLARRVDGIIMTPTRDWQDRSRATLLHSGVPCVLVDRLEDRRFDQVGCEGAGAAEAMVHHLLSHGHTRIGFIRGLQGLATTRPRETGYRTALTARRLTVEPGYVVDGLSTVRGGRLAAEQLMALPRPPTAVFAANNNMTMGMLAALRQLRVRVPEDVAVAAFDDLEWSDIVRPGVTSIAQPFHAMGCQAMQLLLRRLADPETPPRTVLLPASLEFRESCGCPGPAEATGPPGAVATGSRSAPQRASARS